MPLNRSRKLGKESTITACLLMDEKRIVIRVKQTKKPIHCELHCVEPFSSHIPHGTCLIVHIKGALALANCSSSCSEWTLPVLHFTFLSSSPTLFCPSGAFGSHQPRFSLHTSNLEPRLYLTVCVAPPSIIIASALQ